MARFSIYLSDDLNSTLEDLKKDEDSNKSEIVRNAIKFYLNNKDKLESIEDLRTKVAEKDKKLQDHKERIEGLEEKLQEKNEKIEKQKSSLDSLESDLKEKKEKIRNLESRSQTLEAKLESKNSTIESKDETISTLQTQLSIMKARNIDNIKNKANPLSRFFLAMALGFSGVDVEEPDNQDQE